MTDPSFHPSLLVAAIAALAVGPLADRVTRRRPAGRALLDGALSGLLVGLVALHVLPEGYAVAGPAALLAALVGFVGPRLLERGVGGGVASALAVVGLGVHALLDGVALGTPPLAHAPERSALGFAVIVHRLPVGLLVWGLVRARFGPRGASLALALMGAITLAGAGLGHAAPWGEENVALALFQTLVGGTLLHVVREESPFAAQPPGGCCGGAPRGWAGPRGEALGFLAGIGLGLVLPGLHSHVEGGPGARFLDLALESAPALLLGFVLAGVVAAYLPRAPLGWAGRGSRLTQAAKGLAFGLPLPICSCGVVPVYRSLVARGLPGSAALAFLVATPELGVESILLTVPLLGGAFTGARVAAAALLALAVGLLVGRLADRRLATTEAAGCGASAIDAAAPGTDEGEGGVERLRRAARFGFVEVVDDVAMWIVVGLALAAALAPGELGPLLDAIPHALRVPVATLLGIPLYVCASGATPLAAALVAAGLSPGAALAFLLSGPSTNVTTFGVLRQIHGPAAAVGFAAVMIGGATILGWATDALLPAGAVDASRLGAHAHGLGAWIALVLVASLFLGALFRRGPRALARELG